MANPRCIFPPHLRHEKSVSCVIANVFIPQLYPRHPCVAMGLFGDETHRNNLNCPSVCRAFCHWVRSCGSKIDTLGFCRHRPDCWINRSRMPPARMNPNSLKNLALGQRKREGLESLTLRIYGPVAALQWFRGLTARERGEEVKDRHHVLTRDKKP